MCSATKCADSSRISEMNLYNIYYADLLGGSDEIQTYWRSSHETIEEVKCEIEVESGKMVRIQNMGFDYFTHVYSYDVNVFTVEK